jgi:hypothetical protein
MTKHACLLGVASFLWTSTQAFAGGPPPAQLVVEKIVFEPNEKAPKRVQIWGQFALLDNGAHYGAPVKGYLYYEIEQGKEEKAKKEIDVVKKAAGRKYVVSFGHCGYPDVKAQLRKPGVKPASPVAFPLEGDGFNIEKDPTRWHPELQSLVKLLAPAKPEGEKHVVVGKK